MAKRHIPNRKDIKQFVEVFDKLVYGHSASTVFNDFTTMMACTISNGADSAQYQQREDLYLQTAKRYSGEELFRFAELAAITVCSLGDDPNQDFLGEVYTGLNLLDHHNQQFFTPYNISLMMAKMLCGDPKKTIRSEGYIPLMDPACGSGGMLIASVNALRAEGVDVLRDVCLIAQDIDPCVARVCYIQLALLGCSAIVRIGNSLIPNSASPANTWLTPGMFQDIWVDRGLMEYEAETTKKRQEDSNESQ